MDAIAELVSYIEFDRSQTHHQHWATGSRAEHDALNTFYHDVIKAIDTLVENYIGMFGEFDFTTCEDKPVKNIAKHLSDRADWIEANREMICQGSNSIGALVDDLTTVYTHAVYMLRLK